MRVGIRMPIVGLVTFNVKYLDFDGHHIRLQLVNNVLNIIVVQLVGMVNRLIGKDILSKEGNDILKISLYQFPEVINALQRVDVRSIDFNSTSLDVCLFLKWQNIWKILGYSNNANISWLNYGTLQSKNQTPQMLQRHQHLARNGSPGRHPFEQHRSGQQLAVRRRRLPSCLRHLIKKG